MINTTQLDKIILGRIKPQIYAFETNTYPNFLKIGDTYRPVEVRLNEWRAYFKNLREIDRESAVVDDKFFRDYSVHQFVINEKHRRRIEPKEYKKHFSNEFFYQATKEDVKEAIEDIYKSYADQDGKYSFYNLDDHVESNDYKRSEAEWILRDNQKVVVKNFKEAISRGRRHLLMYAVMRFGKSFTALCCAQAMNADLVAVVSAKGDVINEWRKNIQQPKNFESFYFIDSRRLKRNYSIIEECKAKGLVPIVCLTLQDISTDKIKDRYEQLFNEQIDLLIIDETHFGARAGKYGRVLDDAEASKDANEEAKQEKQLPDESIEDVEQNIHALKANVQLHLSGTPYRILMSDEFKKEDIICSCQYTDIVAEGKAWNKNNLDSKEEWENPYFGFPEMIRFAFDLNESSVKKLKSLERNGVSASLNELFKPQAISKKSGYEHFVHETEVFDFLSVIDGSKDDRNILGFLNYKPIRDGKLCNHIVCVLPFRASCDAMQKLIEANKDKFANLDNYEVINVAGFNNEGFEKPERIVSHIKACADRNIKTITLTVNKMLTGTTVPEWDTMLVLKESSSPQEYDQATFRIQSAYTKTYVSPNGEKIKYCMKPQTLLIDFAPHRMFTMQANKALVDEVISGGKGNENLEEGIKRNIEISPIFYVNHNKMERVTETNIIDAVRRYASNKSIRDEATEIPVDLTALADHADLRKLIMELQPIDAKDVFKEKANQGQGNGSDANTGEHNGTSPGEKPTLRKDEESETDKLKKRLETLYSLVLFFAFLTQDRVRNLHDIINLCEKTEDNKRILSHIGLSKKSLFILKQGLGWSSQHVLDYKIDNINSLANDNTLPGEQRVENAMRQFGRWSSSEVITQNDIARKMVSSLPQKAIDNETKILDIASKEGEFALALTQQLAKRIDKNKIYSIPTSGLAYEFTRKIYMFLDMPTENIYSQFNSYDLIGDRKEEIFKILQDMNFNIIIGNPPYQDPKATEKAKTNKAFSSALYPQFIDFGIHLKPSYISMITPSRWMTKTGQGISDQWVDKMINSNHYLLIDDYYNALDCFKSVEIKGGVNYFVYSDQYNGDCKYTLHQNGSDSTVIGKLNELQAGIIVRDPMAIGIIKKIKAVENETTDGKTEEYFSKNSFASLVGPQHFYDKDGVLTTRWKGYMLEKDEEHTVKYYLNRQLLASGYAWIKRSDVPKNVDTIDKHKIFLSKAYNGGDAFPHQIIGKAFYGEPGSICSQTYLVVGYKDNFTKEMCENIISYMSTRFFRYLVFIKKKTQDNPSNVFQFVPLQDFARPWSDADLYAKYSLSDKEINFIESTIKPME